VLLLGCISGLVGCSEDSTSTSNSTSTPTGTADAGGPPGNLQDEPNIPLEGLTTSAEISADGEVESISMTVPVSSMGTKNSMAVLPVAASAKGKTFVDHVRLEWRPNGHPPSGRTTVPHFDTHFEGIPIAEREAIDCRLVGDVPPERIPPAYDTTSLRCQPAEGKFFADLEAPGWKPSEAPQPLTTAVFLTAYSSKIISIDPLFAKSVLDEKKNVEMKIRSPQKLGARWPTRTQALFDAAKETWTIVVRDFVQID
jgi:hypothetical protein